MSCKNSTTPQSSYLILMLATGRRARLTQFCAKQACGELIHEAALLFSLQFVPPPCASLSCMPHFSGMIQNPSSASSCQSSGYAADYIIGLTQQLACLRQAYLQKVTILLDNPRAEKYLLNGTNCIDLQGLPPLCQQYIQHAIFHSSSSSRQRPSACCLYHHGF